MHGTSPYLRLCSGGSGFLPMLVRGMLHAFTGTTPENKTQKEGRNYYKNNQPSL
jgi:hypothetical protein